MLASAISTWEKVRDSLWGLPLAIALVCAGLAVELLGLELPWVSEIGWLYSGGSGQAPQFASSLVGAMITLTALAFSITMVVLTLAAQQLGPRLIETFMRDRGTQMALGLFIGTVVYLLLVLRALDGTEASKSPALAITVGTGLVLCSVIALLFFVHSLARSIVADAVVARVGAALDQAIYEAFPKETADGNDLRPPTRGMPVQLSERGYVQRIDHKSLVRLAKQNNAVIELAYDVGTHVINGEIDAWANCIEDISDAIGGDILIGTQRTPGHDPEWSERQLVEIALRALSSGVNDVFTALAVIDRLSLSLALLATRGDATRVWRDEDGVPRVYGPAPGFALMLGAAFDQIREAGTGQGAVLRRVADNLCKLARCRADRHAAALEQQFALLETAASQLHDAAERPFIAAAIRRGRDALHQSLS